MISHRAQTISQSTDSDRTRWPFLQTNFQLVGQLDCLGIAIESGFKKKANKKRKKERKKILCLSHFIILKLSKIVNAKMIKITGEQFFFEMFPILQCKEFLWIQGNVFVFYWILLYNNHQYFLYYFDWSQMSHELIFVIRNEPWLS